MVKILHYIILFVVLICINNFSAFPCDQRIADSCYCNVHVVMIDSTKDAFFIYATIEKDSTQIAIVSLNYRFRRGQKVEVGGDYILNINPYYKDNIFPNHMMLFDILLSGKKINVPSKGWASNVYTSSDLVGLTIIQKRGKQKCSKQSK